MPKTKIQKFSIRGYSPFSSYQSINRKNAFEIFRRRDMKVNLDPDMQLRYDRYCSKKNLINSNSLIRVKQNKEGDPLYKQFLLHQNGSNNPLDMIDKFLANDDAPNTNLSALHTRATRAISSIKIFSNI